MANTTFSQFFPAAGTTPSGGGSASSSDPLTLNRIQVRDDLLKLKRGPGTVDGADALAFWSYLGANPYGQLGAVKQLAASQNTFQEVVNVTNTGKGGKLVAVIGPLTSTGTVVTFKITIDGTATEIEATSSINQTMRFCLGGILAGNPVSVNNTTITGQIASPFNGGYYFSWADTFSSNANGFVSSASTNYWSIPTTFNQVNQIVFTDTCKVEIKANVSGTTNQVKSGVVIIPN